MLNVLVRLVPTDVIIAMAAQMLAMMQVKAKGRP